MAWRRYFAVGVALSRVCDMDMLLLVGGVYCVKFMLQE